MNLNDFVTELFNEECKGIKCPKCKTENKDGAKKCEKCGIPLEAKK